MKRQKTSNVNNKTKHLLQAVTYLAQENTFKASQSLCLQEVREKFFET